MDRQSGSNLDVLLHNYSLGRTIGHGTFGKVKIAQHKLTGQEVAVKILYRQKMKKGEEEKVVREIKILRTVIHPHIIRLYEVIETPSHIYIIMEYAKSGELHDYITSKYRLQEDEARRFFQQIISGLEYCHRNMLVHRDLKPENLLLDSHLNVKIADFGFGNITRDGHFLRTSCGSPEYAAPEVFWEKLYAGPEVDVWSCGVVLYALLCSDLPFKTNDGNTFNLKNTILAGRYRLPGHLSPGASDLIQRMIVVDPMRRITVPEIRQHPWFQVNLPRHLAVPPPNVTQQAKKLDEEILEEVVRMGFDRNHLIESLSNRLQNEGTVSYCLLFDNRFGFSSGYPGAEFLESTEVDHMHDDGDEASLSAGGHCYRGYVDYQGIGLQPPSSVWNKWSLGLKSRAHPHNIMIEVQRALLVMNVGWKNIGHYNMKCRMVYNTPHNGHDFGNESSIINNEVCKSPNVVKFEVQLYKTVEGKYLLDLQRLQGSHMLFLELCTTLLAQLGVI